MRFTFIPFLLLAVPMAEIAVFVMVGSQIGVLATLGLVVVTAVAGAILLRVQGFGVLERIRRTLEADQIPGRELVHGVMIMIAGILLLTPGFVTDTCGFLLFVPAIRDIGWRFVRERIVVQTVGARHPGQGPGPKTGPTIDLDEDDYSTSRKDPNSPWIGRND
ncbi:membrane protein FxsA [Chelativorans sp. ZYF759]|uniref:FxsA family protein n=1 Tax=Chelativorans sp. ZYF759 TaxID=2692213 RepID=UPI00145F5010|nr:membrane protein FxsA [Chelativorans sp. ZYF759]